MQHQPVNAADRLCWQAIKNVFQVGVRWDFVDQNYGFTYPDDDMPDIFLADGVLRSNGGDRSRKTKYSL